MKNKHLTSKELLEKTGISRATLNNYVALGILPRPEVRKPTSGDSNARRMGYFPASAIDTIERVQQLKRTGMSMDEISSRTRNNPEDPDTSITDSRLSYDVLTQDDPDVEETPRPRQIPQPNQKLDQGVDMDIDQNIDQELPQQSLYEMETPAPSEHHESETRNPESENHQTRKSETKTLFDHDDDSNSKLSDRRVNQVPQSDSPRQFTRNNEPGGNTEQARRLTIDNVEGPAYMVNNQYEVEWSNDQANSELFGISDSLPKDITECNIFPLLFNWQTMIEATDKDELLKFHLAPAKNRIPRSKLYGLGQHMNGEHIENLLQVYDKVEKFDRSTIQHTTVNLAPPGKPEKWYLLHATFFREGIFFTYSPSDSPTENLMSLLGRRDIMIRELLQRRRPYLTPLSVLVADIQNSVKICAELPPEEYFELINHIWMTMEPILRKYHATPGKHVGDGLLCYFFPQPDSSYALSSIQCAQEMQKAMKDIDRDWRGRKNWNNQLLLNIGIDEGQEWFGTYQTNSHVEFTVLGDTVNRGGRLSDFATKGTIWGTKNLIGKLSPQERDSLKYGIRQDDPSNINNLIESTFSRISNLVDLELPENQKLKDLGALPVTEILSL